jgi:DNA-binding transcriptional MocR family regulator
VQFAEGRLAAGVRLPSSRALAAELGLARSTVVLGFEAAGGIVPRSITTAAGPKSTQTHVRECHAEIKAHRAPGCAEQMTEEG